MGYMLISSRRMRFWVSVESIRCGRFPLALKRMTLRDQTIIVLQQRALLGTKILSQLVSRGLRGDLVKYPFPCCSILSVYSPHNVTRSMVEDRDVAYPEQDQKEFGNIEIVI